ncbi:alpha/beta hydrolase [Fodinicola feengrottensis]|uniref:Alpha/beta hydrolase n=1 Tax=Fodinicola feengrottensis TaxID=435914 RepID=A0ABN2I6P3_9ACTN
MPERSTVTINDLTFTIHQNGPADGPAVVLLHGFPQNSTEWEAVGERLATAGIRSIALDQRGYSPGARPDGVPNYQVSELVSDVVGLLDALDLPTAHVAGHDWGAVITWQLVAHHPDRFLGAVPVSVPHPVAFAEALQTDPDQQQKSGYFQLFRTEGKAEEALLGNDAAFLRGIFTGLDPAHIQAYVDQMSAPGALTAALSWYRAMDLSSREPFPEITNPITFVWGSADIALGRVAAENTASKVAGPYEFIELDGVDHWVPERAPEAVADAIIKQIKTS